MRTQLFFEKTDRVPIWIMPVLIFLVFPRMNSEEDQVRMALVQFMTELSPENVTRTANWGWNSTSDPCNDMWEGVTCVLVLNRVMNITLDHSNLTGVLDASSLCITTSLEVLNLKNNNISGTIPEEIANCLSLNQLFLTGNKFSGDLPRSLSQMPELKRLDISDNNFTGEFPDLPKIPGLFTFFAQNNRLSGKVPNFNFPNLEEFNVSNNNLSGLIPDVNGRFGADSFSGNPELCGTPLLNACPPQSESPESPNPEYEKKIPRNQFFIYSGYLIVVLLVIVIIAFKLVSKSKSKEQTRDVENAENTIDKDVSLITTMNKVDPVSRSGYSLASIDSLRDYSYASPRASLHTVVSNPETKGLTFEDLLRAPAELLARGKHGSTYKVMLDNGVKLAVKRIKDWGISSDQFELRMNMINQVNHPNVLPQVAFYCSKQEKLLVQEYQHNGSLFQLLQGALNGQKFVWGSRLTVAAYIADALSFMFKEFEEDGIAHGNLKSSNILFNENNDPCISEYGLMTLTSAIEDEDQSFISPLNSFTAENPFQADVYGFGVILLELLTGKAVKKKGLDLSLWVQSVVREEWTVDVFDEALILEGANEERMVNLLQVALKCINPCADERPNTCHVAAMLNSIKDEEDESISFKP